MSVPVLLLTVAGLAACLFTVWFGIHMMMTPATCDLEPMGGSDLCLHTRRNGGRLIEPGAELPRHGRLTTLDEQMQYNRHAGPFRICVGTVCTAATVWALVIQIRGFAARRSERRRRVSPR